MDRPNSSFIKRTIYISFTFIIGSFGAGISLIALDSNLGSKEWGRGFSTGHLLPGVKKKIALPSLDHLPAVDPIVHHPAVCLPSLATRLGPVQRGALHHALCPRTVPADYQCVYVRVGSWSELQEEKHQNRISAAHGRDT